MDTRTNSREEFKRLLREHVREDEDRRFQEFPQQALTWLAVAPAWPLQLAQEGFPVENGHIGTGKNVAEMMSRTATAHFSETGRSNDTPGETVYWMNQLQRSFVINKVIEKDDRGIDYVRAEMHNAGIAMSRAAEKGLMLSQPLMRWSALASCTDDNQMVELIAEKVDQSLTQAKESKQMAAPEALRWIEAAEPFAKLFKGPLEVAVTRAGRKLELFHRRASDERFLKNFYARPAQEQAFKDLLDGPDALWALHYVGLGGTGKTMLMRHISSQIAPSQEYNLAVARIDFDHLNPDYPSVRPGLLLTGLAEELRAHADEFANQSFRRFDKAILSLHEKVRGKAGDGSTLSVSIDDPAFREVLDLFISEVGNLANHKRPLLILDTCEELAKIRPDGKTPESVRITFEILEYIHEKVPQIRVVFSGRRPLAWEGPDWVFSTPDVKQSKEVKLQDKREYLRLHEIRGFTREEALDFLARYRKNDNRVNRALFEAILQQSRASDQTFDSRFEFTDRLNSTDTATRYNPFDLDMYATWSCDDENLDEKKLEKGAHHYVRERIVGRAGADVQNYLPEIALLGRFDKEMMRGLINNERHQFDVLFPELIDQEWIDVDRGANQTATVWAMDNVMRKRLLDYYDDAEQSTLNTARTRISDYLYEITLTRNWHDLTPSYFEAPLKRLTSNKVRAAEWWAKVEARLAESGEWNWALTLTDLLLAEGGPAAKADLTAGQKPEQENVLRPAILATRAAALTHLKPTEVRDTWMEVLEKAHRHPVKEEVNRLEFRAMAGVIATLRLPEKIDQPAQLFDSLLMRATSGKRSSKWELTDLQSVAALIAMLEGLVEALECFIDEGRRLEEPAVYDRDHASGVLYAQNLYDYLKGYIHWPEDVPDDLRAFSHTLHGRMSKISSNMEEAAAEFDKALGYLKSEKVGLSVQRWQDWHRPDDLASRIRLEYIRAMYPVYQDVETTLRRVEYASPKIVTIDADRLASAVLMLQGYVGVPALSDHHEEELSRSLGLQAVLPSCNAHRQIQPYFASILEARAAQGFVDEVVRRALDISKEAEMKGNIRSQQAAERVLLRLACQMRLHDERSINLGSSLNNSDQLEDINGRFILAALDGAKSTEKLDGYLNNEPLDLKRERHAALAHIGWRTGRPLIEPQEIEFQTAEGDTSFQQLLKCLEELIGPGKDSNTYSAEANSAANKFRSLTYQTFSLFLDALEATHKSPATAKIFYERFLRYAWHIWAEAHPSEPVEALTLYWRANGFLRQEGTNTEMSITKRLAENLMSRVGARRAAGIIFEDSMLAALRPLEEEHSSLMKAAKLYESFGDGIGRLLSNIDLALADARSRDSNGPLGDKKNYRHEYLDLYNMALESRLKAIHYSYLECARLYPSLPAWATLYDDLIGERPVTAAQLTEHLDFLEGTCWRPWLVRMVGCMVRWREVSEPGELTKALRDWVEKNYSTVVNEQTAIPAEFDSSFLYPETASFSDYQEKLPWTRRLRVFLSRYEKWIFGVIGFAFVIFGFFVLSSLTSYLIRITTGTTLGFWYSLGITIVAIISLSQLPSMIRWYVALAMSLLKSTYTIENEEPVKDLNRPLQSPSILRAKFRLRFLKLSSSEPKPTKLNATTKEEYTKLPEIWPMRNRALEARVNRWMGDKFYDLTLVVNEENAAAPWEAVFGLVEKKDVGLVLKQTLFRRVVESPRVKLLEPLKSPVQVLSWASDLSHMDMARSGWRLEKTGNVRFEHEVERPDPLISKRRKEIDILHLIGTPIETSSGIRLEIGEASEFTSRSSSFVEQQSSKSANENFVRGFLMSPDELFLRFTEPRLCIVQGLPKPQDESRTSADRFEAAKLRRFGAGLLKSGIPGVILLPPTRREISIELISHLAKLVSQSKSNVKQWMRTVRALQETITKTSHMDSEAALEMALDVCIYMVDDFEFRVTAP